MLDSIRRGEAPIASHLLYPQILDDLKSDERELGMQAGWAWMAKAEAVVCYVDFGLSSGMTGAVELAAKLGVPIEYRKLDG